MLKHPTRVAVLQSLLDRDEATPKELAAQLGLSIAHVSYHVRCLREAGQLTLVRSTPTRGVLSHHYRLERPRETVEMLRRLGYATRADAEPPTRLSREWEILRRAVAELCARRERQGLTRQALARRVGLRASDLRGLERGETDPRFTVLADLARELGTSIGALLLRAEAALGAPERGLRAS